RCFRLPDRSGDWGEQPVSEPPFGEAISQAGREATKAVFDAAAEVDRGSLGKVFRRATDFANGEALPKDLGQHLIVEYEVIRVSGQVNAFEDLARECAIAGVVLG